MKVLYVKNWAYHEHRDQRKIERMKWVRHKIDLGGDDWVTLMEEAEAPLEVLGVWDIVLKLAALSPVRGWLLTDPSDPERVLPYVAEVSHEVSHGQSAQNSQARAKNSQKDAEKCRGVAIGPRVRADGEKVARGVHFLRDVLGWLGEREMEHEEIVSAVVSAREKQTQPVVTARHAKNLRKNRRKVQKDARNSHAPARKARLDTEGEGERELTHRAQARACVRAREDSRAVCCDVVSNEEEEEKPTEGGSALDDAIPDTIQEAERRMILEAAQRPSVASPLAYVRSAVRGRWFRDHTPPDEIPGLRDIAEGWLDWAIRVEGVSMSVDDVMRRMAPYAARHGSDAVSAIIDEVGNATTPDKPSSIWRHLNARLTASAKGGTEG